MVYMLMTSDGKEIKNWGIEAKRQVANHFTLDGMLDQLEAYFYDQMDNFHR